MSERTIEDIEEIKNYYSDLYDGKRSLDKKEIVSYKLFLKVFSKDEIIESLDIGYSRGINNIVRYSYGILHVWRKEKNELCI